MCVCVPVHSVFGPPTSYVGIREHHRAGMHAPTGTTHTFRPENLALILDATCHAMQILAKIDGAGDDEVIVQASSITSMVRIGGFFSQYSGCYKN